MKVALLLSWIAVATAAPTPKLKNSEADPLLSIRKTDELWQRTAQEDCGICEGEVTAEIGKTDELWQRTVDEDCEECEGTVEELWQRTAEEDCTECEDETVD